MPARPVIQHRPGHSSVTRIASNFIESAITDQIRHLLNSGHELLSKVVNGELNAAHQKQLIAKSRSLSDNWDQQKPRERIAFLQKIIRRIVISQNRIDIHYSSSGISGAFLPDIPGMDDCDDASNDIYQVSIPAQLKRCRIETKLIVSETVVTQSHERTVKAIRDSLKKALNWNQALVSGEAATMAVLARAEGVTRRYIAHINKPAFLALDIMDAIIKGRIPATLSLGTLKKGIPLEWQEQRERFGFT